MRRSLVAAALAVLLFGATAPAYATTPSPPKFDPKDVVRCITDYKTVVGTHGETFVRPIDCVRYVIQGGKFTSAATLTAQPLLFGLQLNGSGFTPSSTVQLTLSLLGFTITLPAATDSSGNFTFVVPPFCGGGFSASATDGVHAASLNPVC